MNNFTAIGRLTKDPEAASTANQKVYCRFTIAVDRGYKGADGNKITDFIPCLSWDPTATLITRYFHKGDLIGISGRLESSSYEDKGEKRTSYSILVNSIDFIQGKKESKPEPQAPKNPIEPPTAPNYELPIEIEDEEPPFDV